MKLSREPLAGNTIFYGAVGARIGNLFGGGVLNFGFPSPTILCRGGERLNATVLVQAEPVLLLNPTNFSEPF